VNWREPLLRLLRVPADPTPPPGSPPRLFRAAPAFFTLRLLRWGVTQIVALAGLLWALQFIRWVDQSRAPEFVVWLLRAGEIFGWVAFAFEFVFGWLMVRLDFEMRWYMLSDRAIRIREGVVSVREKTIALANVQNLSIRQGPLQRFLGIADVEVKTAGGGGSSGDHEGKRKGGEPMHVAYFRGVANAEEIRDLVREGVRVQRDAGLGDPDEPVPDDAVAAAAELLREARALRAAVS
jgi:uncharacterized membrane protein YdbT with pleckstrin-like domain